MNSYAEEIFRNAKFQTYNDCGGDDDDDEGDSNSESSDCVEIKNEKVECGEFGAGSSNPCFVDSAEPYVGKTFVSFDEAHKFYIKFARKIGFEIRIKSRKKSKKLGDWSCCLFQCKKAGKPNILDGEECVRSGKSVRRRDVLVPTDCKARMYMSYDREEECWKVTTYESRHNHEMVSPSKKVFMHSSRNVNELAREMIDVYRKSNIGASKMHHVFQTQAGGIENVGFNLKDIENAIRDLRREEGIINDAEAAIEYLERAQLDSGGQFFYRARYTDDNRLKTLVWVDSKSRAAYKSFGDVVTFDTTYRTNRYDMPFAPFTGVNHHYHSILFGYALLGDEKEETFLWVLSTWLEAMDGLAPQTIITDQCQQIGDAIRKVFPYSHHGLCTWHISNKYPDKFNQVYRHHPTFKAEYDMCVTKSLSVDEFQQRWSSMIHKYDLGQNEWLAGLYEIRDQWIPVYTKRHFAAGMTTTARSEGMNHFFDQFVSSCTSVSDFVRKSVEDALEKQLFRERKDDFDSKYYSRKLDCASPLEHHAANVYTKTIFRHFQTELKKASHFVVSKVKDGEIHGDMRMYVCHNMFPSKNKDRRSFSILFNKDSGQMTCNCLLFEHMGILCRHLLKLLLNKNTCELPPRYILQRWTVGANKFYVHDTSTSQFEPSGSQTMRYNHLAQLGLGYAQKASCTIQGYTHALNMYAREDEYVDSIPLDHSQLNAYTGEQCQFVGVNDGDDVTGDGDEGVPSQVHDPIIVARKGRKREKRLKRPIEEMKGGKPLRICSICGFPTDHDKRTHWKVYGEAQP